MSSMRLKQTIQFVSSVSLLFISILFLTSTPLGALTAADNCEAQGGVYNTQTNTCSTSSTSTSNNNIDPSDVNLGVNTDGATQECAGVKTSVIGCSTAENNGVWAILKLVMQIMTGGIGVLAVGGLVYAGILYTAAHGQPDQVKKARGMITNVVVGIIMYAVMFSLLNFLVPGGIFEVPIP